LTEFASRWPDVRLWAVNRVKARIADSNASAERQESLARQVVVSVSPQQLETALSRIYFVSVEAWDAASKAAALKLSSDAAYELESAPRDAAPVVRASLNTGPNEFRDTATGKYSYETVVLVVVARLP